MRVKLALCGLAVLLLLAMTACGGGSASGGGGGGQVTLQSIAVRPATPGINVGDQKQFTATGTYSDASSKDITASVTWNSSDNTVASVSSGGLATGLHGGQATITATSGSVHGNATLSVTAVLQTITVAPNTPFNVGAQQQFTATGNYNDGTNQDLTKQVAWQSSDTSVATVNGGGKATGVHGGQVTISATDIGSGIVGSVNVQVNAVLQSIAISPIGPAVQTTKTVTFTATGSFNDGTQADVTSATSFASSDNTVASFAANVATGLKAGAVTVTATDGSFNSTTSLHVVDTPTPALSGTYTFTLFGADTRGTQFYAGSFTADGNGNITAGVEDANTGGGIGNDSLSGTYTQGPDGRGDMVFSNSIHPNGLTLRFVTKPDQTNSFVESGKMIEFDGAGTLKGSFELQSIGDELDAATYAFRLAGADAAVDNGGMGEIGVFDADGVDTITSGTADINDHGTITTLLSLDPSKYDAPDANGRGTLQIVVGPTTSTFAYYVVNSGKINLIQIDDPNGSPKPTALGGVAEEQEAHTFVNADLNAGFAFLLDHTVVVNTPSRGEFNTIGRLEFDGLSGIVAGGSSKEDEDNAAPNNPNPQVVQSGSYNFQGGVNGRGVTTITLIQNPPPNLDRTMIFYMVSTSKMFMMRTFDGPNGSGTAATGIGELQVPPLNKSKLSGSYTLAASELSEENVENLGLLDFDGAGNVTGVVDSSLAGVLSSGVIAGNGVNGSGTYTVVSTDGRGPIETTAPAESNYIFYLLSPDKALVMGISGGPGNPGADTDGTLEKR